MGKDMNSKDCIRIGSSRYGKVRRMYSGFDWFNNNQYVVLKYDGQKLRFIKCYLEIPKNAFKIINGAASFGADIPEGVYEIIHEESNEDELIAYLSDHA